MRKGEEKKKKKDTKMVSQKKKLSHSCQLSMLRQ